LTANIVGGQCRPTMLARVSRALLASIAGLQYVERNLLLLVTSPSDLHWLPVAVRIEFKICVLAYVPVIEQYYISIMYISRHAACNQSPHFCVKLISAVRQILICLYYRVLVFESVNELLVQPIECSIPTEIKQAATLLTFKKKLKIFLFSNKKLNCRRETARRFVSLNTSLIKSLNVF